MDSIVILTHNKSDYTRACLRSVLGTRPPTFEALVVDNGSTDDTPAMLAEMTKEFECKGLRLRTISPGRNIGCSTARNMAVAEAKGEQIVFLDNDTLIVDFAWLEKLRAVLESEPKAAIITPKLLYPFEPPIIQCAGVGISRTGRVLFRGRGEPADDPRFAKRNEVQAAISACIMFPRRLYDEIGGLDEAFNPIQHEDFDFCYRARSRGYRVIYTPDPVVHHWESVTSDGSPGLVNRYIVIKHGMLFKKRWHHMFEEENGPSDEETKWKVIEAPSLKGRRRRVGER